jgi:hypothetical protein
MSGQSKTRTQELEADNLDLVPKLCSGTTRLEASLRESGKQSFRSCVSQAELGNQETLTLTLSQRERERSNQPWQAGRLPH